MSFPRFVISGFIAVVVVVFSGASKAGECSSYPKVSLWGELSHQKIINVVASRHKGDWSKYLEKWDNQLAKLEGFYAKGATVAFPKRKGLRLSGQKLADYITLLKKRIDVNRCLAANNDPNMLKALSNFSTAAGSRAKSD